MNNLTQNSTPVFRIEATPTTLIEDEGTTTTITIKLVQGSLPAGGVNISIGSDVANALGQFDIFSLPLQVTYTGGQIVGGLSNSSSFTFKVLQPTATITLPVYNDADLPFSDPNHTVNNDIGIVNLTFTIADGSNYDVVPDADSVTLKFADTQAQLNPPVGNDDTGTTPEDQMLSGNVLTNDSDPDGDSLAVSAVNGSTASVGTQITLASGALLTLNADGTYTYNPSSMNDNLNVTQTETDSFEYTVSDGELTDTATVTVTVADVSTTPVVSLQVSPNTLSESQGTVLTYTFTLSSPPPSEGVTITVNGDVAENLNQLDLFNVEVTGGESLVANADLSGFDFTITAQTATITVPIFADSEVEEPILVTYSLAPGEGYEVDPNVNSETVTIADELSNLDIPVVSFTIEPTSLNEGDSLTITFNVTGTIPTAGLEIDVASDVLGSLNEFTILPGYTGLAGAPTVNSDASGFSATITQNTATITLDVLDDGLDEGVETLVFSLVDGENYDVDPDASEVSLTIDDGDGDQFFGTVGDDKFEARVSPEGFSGSNDLVFAGTGEDLFDTSTGSGNNRLYGQADDDTFFLGSNDDAFGGAGNDTFYLLGGGNTIIGGGGADWFRLAVAEFPEVANIVSDFEKGADILGINGLGLSFTDLSLTQQGSNTLISAQGKDIALLLGVNSTQLSSDHFVLI